MSRPPHPVTPHTSHLQVRVRQAQAEQAALQRQKLGVLVIHTRHTRRRLPLHHACGRREGQRVDRGRRWAGGGARRVAALAEGAASSSAAAQRSGGRQRGAPAASFSMRGRGRWVEKLRWKESYSPRCTSSTTRATAASVGCSQGAGVRGRRGTADGTTAAGRHAARCSSALWHPICRRCHPTGPTQHPPARSRRQGHQGWAAAPRLAACAASRRACAARSRAAAAPGCPAATGGGSSGGASGGGSAWAALGRPRRRATGPVSCLTRSSPSYPAPHAHTAARHLGVAVQDEHLVHVLLAHCLDCRRRVEVQHAHDGVCGHRGWARDRSRGWGMAARAGRRRRGGKIAEAGGGRCPRTLLFLANVQHDCRSPQTAANGPWRSQGRLWLAAPGCCAPGQPIDAG